MRKLFRAPQASQWAIACWLWNHQGREILRVYDGWGDCASHDEDHSTWLCNAFGGLLRFYEPMTWGAAMPSTYCGLFGVERRVVYGGRTNSQGPLSI